MSTIQPVIVTADQDVLLGFYTKLFGAEEIFRVPAEGPAFYRGLRIGDTDLGRVSSRDQWVVGVRSLIQIIEARRWRPAR
jgi:hypothetical protein